MIQDWILAAGNLIFVLAMLPALFNSQTEMPRSASLTTATILAAFAGTNFSLGLPLASVMNAAGFLVWLGLAIWRPIRSAKPEGGSDLLGLERPVLRQRPQEFLLEGSPDQGLVPPC